MDVTSPFPKSSSGHQYILAAMGYATRFLEVIPLHMVMAPKVTMELTNWVGTLKEIVTDQKTHFMLGVLHGFCKTLHIGHL